MKIYKKKDDVIVRSMIKSDIEKIINELKIQGWHADISKFENYLDMQKNQLRSVFIASKNQIVLGYVTLDFNPSYGPFKNQNIPMVIDLNVFQKYQHQGIGSLLMDTIEEYAFKYADFIGLGVGLHIGYGHAQRLYIKRGYIPDGTGVWYQNDIATPYERVSNDDDLNLYLVKKKSI